MSNDPRVEQDYDPDPPRCFTCVYFRHEKPRVYVERTIRMRSGKTKTIMVRNSKKERASDFVTRCSFGNFATTGKGVCNQWHSRTGETLEESEPPHAD